MLGELFIPCRVVNANSEESYLISLVENIARRQHSYMELLSGIKILNDRGYKPVDIARKIGFSKSHVNSILHLINAGEERLINAVEQGILPITIAISISRSDDQEVQKQLSIILSCLNKLFEDKYFQLVLKSEHLDDMPKDLSQRMLKQREGNIYA